MRPGGCRADPVRQPAGPCRCRTARAQWTVLCGSRPSPPRVPAAPNAGDVDEQRQERCDDGSEGQRAALKSEMSSAVRDAAAIDGEHARRVAADARHVACQQRLHHQSLDGSHEQDGSGIEAEVGSPVHPASCRPRAGDEAVRRSHGPGLAPTALAGSVPAAAVHAKIIRGTPGCAETKSMPGHVDRFQGGDRTSLLRQRGPPGREGIGLRDITACRMASLVGKRRTARPGSVP